MNLIMCWTPKVCLSALMILNFLTLMMNLIFDHLCFLLSRSMFNAWMKTLSRPFYQITDYLHAYLILQTLLSWSCSPTSFWFLICIFIQQDIASNEISSSSLYFIDVAHPSLFNPSLIAILLTNSDKFSPFYTASM